MVASGALAGRTLRSMCAAVVVLAVGGCDPVDTGGDPPSTEAISSLDLLRCSAEVWELLETSGAHPETYAGPPTGTGGRVLRFRSAELGRWYVVTQEPTGALAVVERSPHVDRSWDFGEGCESIPRTGVVGTPLTEVVGAETGTFSDADLGVAIRESAPNPVVVYLWSPHMPLSVDGIGAILQAGAATRVRVELVQIAHADLDFARREATRVGMPPEALRIASSVELLMRDGQLHAPSILIFTEDRASPVLPGYRDAEGYAEFIDAFRSSEAR